MDWPVIYSEEREVLKAKFPIAVGGGAKPRSFDYHGPSQTRRGWRFRRFLQHELSKIPPKGGNSIYRRNGKNTNNQPDY